MKYPISVWMGYYPEYAPTERIDLLNNAGFSYAEWSHDSTIWLNGENAADPHKQGQQIAQYAASRGFSIPQGHLRFKQGLCDSAALDVLKWDLELFAGIGIKAAVLHCNGGADLPEEVRRERWVENLRTLSDFVDGTGITLCLENLGSTPATHTAQRLKGLISDAGGKNMGICLDMGHLHLTNGRGQTDQSLSEFILEAGDLLKALHVTNNSGAGDDHLMPYSSRLGIDYREPIRALDTIGYKGLFNLEILGECRAPMAIRRAKLDFVRAMCDYMLCDEFLALDETYPLL